MIETIIQIALITIIAAVSIAMVVLYRTSKVKPSNSTQEYVIDKLHRKIHLSGCSVLDGVPTKYLSKSDWWGVRAYKFSDIHQITYCEKCMINK